MLLSKFLKVTSTKILQQSGLGEVFEDTVMPSLLFLPSLTPVDESLRLLPVAYAALYDLCDIRYPAVANTTERMRLYDRIMRHGFLEGYLYSRENHSIVEALVRQADTLVRKMGIHAVKHLKVRLLSKSLMHKRLIDTKDLIPILAVIMTDPFGPANPSLLVVTVKAIQCVILNCWPRMTENVHRIELVKALALCWINIKNDNTEHIVSQTIDNQDGFAGIEHEMKIAAQLLVNSVHGKIDMNELEPLRASDKRLAELFPICSQDATHEIMP